MKQHETAAKWWRNVLENGAKFDNMGDTGSPEERRTSDMTSMLAKMNVKPVTKEQLDTFERELVSSLEGKEDRLGLHCDYGPDLTLSEAAKIAGISTANFPWKTNMFIREDGTVSVSYGYGAEDVEVTPC